MSPNQDAIVVLSLARGTSADQAAQEFFRQQGVRPAGTQRATINGMPAITGVFEAVSGQTLIAGRVAFIEHGGKVYRMLGYTPQARWRTYDRVFAAGDPELRQPDRPPVPRRAAAAHRDRARARADDGRATSRPAIPRR